MDREAWDERYREKGLKGHDEPNRFLVPEVEGLTPGKALDLAAGEGRNSVWLAKQGWHVDAVDWSDVALDEGRRKAREAGATVWFTRADLREWWPPAEEYDLVLISYLQIPYLERHGVWRSAARAVRPGGRLIVIGHDWDNRDRGYGPSNPDVLYSVGEAAAVIGENLDVIKAEQVLRPVETDEGIKESVDNIVVALRPA